MHWIVAVALLFMGRAVAQPSIFQGGAAAADQAIDATQCERECRVSKPGGYPCISWCAWQACERAHVETVQVGTGAEGDPDQSGSSSEIGAPAGVYRGPMDPRQQCLSAHPACIADCGVYTTDLRRLSRQLPLPTSPVQACDFAAIRQRYAEMLSALSLDPTRAPEIDVRGFYEQYYADVVPLERDYRAARERLPGELARSAGALAQCRDYGIRLTEPERRVLRRCAPGLLDQVAAADDVAHRRAEQWRETRGIAAGRLAASLAALEQCRTSTIPTTDIAELVMQCEPALGRAIVDVNRRVDALGRSLASAAQVLRSAQANLDACRAIGPTREAIAALDRVPELTQNRCPILREAGEMDRRLGLVLQGFGEDQRAVAELMASSASNFRYCEWDEHFRKVQEARRHLGDAACWQSFPQYRELTAQVNAAEQAGRARAELANNHRLLLARGVGGVMPHVEGRSGPDPCAHGVQANLAVNVPQLGAAIAAVEQAGTGECMLEELARARQLFSASRELQARCVGRADGGLSTRNWMGNWLCRTSDHAFRLTIGADQMSGHYDKAWAGKPANETYGFKIRSATEASGTYMYFDAHPPGRWSGRWSAKVNGGQISLTRNDDASSWVGYYTCTRE